MKNCGNCDHLVSENYCPNCGQPAKLKRIDGHYIVHEIEHVLHFERGILYTVKELLISPGKNVRQFITENRTRLVKPIIFIIVTSLIYTVVNHYFHVSGFISFSDSKESTESIVFDWIQEHYGYANIIMGIYIALWARILFFKHRYNYFEVLILLCFLIGMEMLIFSLFATFTGLTHLNLMPLAGFAGIAYCTWGIGQFFDKTKVISYIKAFASYIAGMITFIFSVTLIGTLFDLIIKH